MNFMFNFTTKKLYLSFIALLIAIKDPIRQIAEKMVAKTYRYVLSKNR